MGAHLPRGTRVTPGNRCHRPAEGSFQLAAVKQPVASRVPEDRHDEASSLAVGDGPHGKKVLSDPIAQPFRRARSRTRPIGG